jgi:hypothetical protein
MADVGAGSIAHGAGAADARQSSMTKVTIMLT